MSCKVQSERAAARQLLLSGQGGPNASCPEVTTGKNLVMFGPLCAHYSTLFAKDARSTPAVLKRQESGAKGKGSKSVLQSVLSIDPPDHGGRDLVSSAIHPYCDCVLLRGRVQIDGGSTRWHPQTGARWCLESRTHRRYVCRRRGEREPLGSRRGVGR